MVAVTLLVSVNLRRNIWVQGKHALTYDMNTADETVEWINLQEVTIFSLLPVDNFCIPGI